MFSVACFSFSTLAKVSSRSSMSFLSSEHSSSSFLFLAVSSALISSSSSSLSVVSLSLASSWILLLIRPSHLSSASLIVSLLYSKYKMKGWNLICIENIILRQVSDVKSAMMWWLPILLLTLLHLQMTLAYVGHSFLGPEPPSFPQVPSSWLQLLPDFLCIWQSLPSYWPALSLSQRSLEEAWSCSKPSSMASAWHSWMSGHCTGWCRQHLWKSVAK